MDRFKVGDRVRIIKNPISPNWVGLEATITAGKHPSWCTGLQETRDDIYSIDIQGIGRIRASTGNKYGVPEDWLAPIYDGWDKTEWKDCYWKPKILEKV